jgi:hypothetical protein
MILWLPYCLLYKILAGTDGIGESNASGFLVLNLCYFLLLIITVSISIRGIGLETRINTGLESKKSPCALYTGVVRFWCLIAISHMTKERQDFNYL